MGKEYQSLITNGTWVLVSKPLNAKLVGNRWRFKLKECIEVFEPTKYKTRLFSGERYGL